MNPFPIAWSDLRRQPAGAITTILLIAVAVALGVAVSAQERALRVGSARAADAFDLLIGAPGSETQLVLSSVYLQPAAIDLLPPGVLAELQAREDVAFAAPLGFGDSHAGHPIVGTTADFVARGGTLAPSEGRLFERIDEVVIGSDVALAVGDRFVPLHGAVAIDESDLHQGFTYRVVGRLPRQGNPWDRAIVAAIESIWWVHGLPVGHALDERAVWPSGTAAPPDLAAVPIGPPFAASELAGVPVIVVKPRSFGAAYALRQTFRGRPDTMAVFPAEVLVQLYALLGDVHDLLGMVSIVTQALVIAATLLAVLATLASRRRLLAILRALGASRGFVFAAVWTGVATTLLAGCALGLLLGYLAAVILSRIVAARTALSLPVELGAPELLLVGVVAVIGLALAAVPAWQALRQPVAEGLKAA